MKFQHCIIINSSSQVCFPYFHMESFYVKRRFIMNVHKMILRFHLLYLFSTEIFFLSRFNLVSGACKSLQALRSIFQFCRLTPSPRPGYGCLYAAIVFRPLWPSYFWQHLFYFSQESYQIITMSPRSSGKSQFCNDATQGAGIICTLLFVRGFFFIFLAISVLRIAQRHNIS